MSRTEGVTRHDFFTHYESLLFHSPHSKFELGVAEGTELRDITSAFRNLNITNTSSHESSKCHELTESLGHWATRHYLCIQEPKYHEHIESSICHEHRWTLRDITNSLSHVTSRTRWVGKTSRTQWVKSWGQPKPNYSVPKYGVVGSV